MAWMAEIKAGSINRAGIARRERITRARVTQIMALLELPDEVREKLLTEDEQVRGRSIREALRSVVAC